VAGSILGNAVRRTEDGRLLAGVGLFVGDLHPEGCLDVVFVRSPVAHARIVQIDTAAAAALPGVVAVHTAENLDLQPRLGFAVLPDVFARPPLARDLVRFAGEAVAVVVAESAAAAADGADAVQVEYEVQPAVVELEAAGREDAPLLFPEHGSNLAFRVEFGQDADPLRDAEVVVRERFVNQRLAAVPMEGNAVLAQPSPDGSGIEVWASTQRPFHVRDTIAEELGLAESQVRVVAPDVGGGFGAKAPVYPEHVVVASLAHRLARPVRWIETRTENLTAMTQGRAQVQQVELGASREGKLTGLKVQVLADAGAYPGLGAFLPYLTGQMISGVYSIPAISYSARSLATNTTPIDAYRGAGRPEAAALIERAMDRLAAELGMDPAELRRRNLIPADAFPHTTVTGATYDSGDYPGALEKALRLAAYDDLRAEQAERRRRQDPLLLGIGLSVYVEVTAAGSPTEFASVEVAASGRALVLAGTSAHGQGHATAFAQIAADALGLPMEAIDVVEGDTALVPRGDGTQGSRSMQLGGSAVNEASLAVLEKARQLAGHLLEVSPDDVVARDGGLGVRGVPHSGMSWAALAAAAAEPERLPPGMEPGLAAGSDFIQADTTYPFGAHVAVVQVDSETGAARLLRHIAVDDCGRVLNPLLAEGQVHGGIAQGVAQALFEEVVYDPDGTPRSTSLADYGVPTAAELPMFETARTETPTPLNPLGAKGIGESGTIGSTPAVQNAVVDALSHLGVRHLDMPLGPERIWRAIREAGV
jgi:carbon-monoxide dehydrogenase large subunit